MKIKWKTDTDQLIESIETTVPVKTDHGKGIYHIWAVRRPKYCDRGDWLINVNSAGQTNLDWQDGFPRYFFGTAKDVKKQMATWISRRKETVK